MSAAVVRYQRELQRMKDCRALMLGGLDNLIAVATSLRARLEDDTVDLVGPNVRAELASVQELLGSAKEDAEQAMMARTRLVALQMEAGLDPESTRIWAELEG